MDGIIYRVQEFQHVKPGKGPAFVRTKLKRVSDGAVIDRTFRAGEKFRAVRNEVKKMQYLYSDGTSAHLMDMETFDQVELPEGLVSDDLRWVKPNEEIDILYVDGNASGIQLPASVELEVTETDPGLKGDTVSGGGEKPATLETGVTIKVPLFVNVGDRVKVQTASGDYVSRV